MDLFKRKKVTNQERASNLTLEQLRQSTDIRFEEIYNYLDEVAKKMLDEGGTIQGNLTVQGEINLSKNTFLSIYPIGSILMNTGQNPSEYLGGTWIHWGSGRVPVGVDTTQTEFATVEKTGGAKTHTLNAEEMPNHTHNLLTIAKTSEWTAPNGVLNYQYTSENPVVTPEFLHPTGGNQPHNNLQPYITCYMWKRTA